MGIISLENLMDKLPRAGMSKKCQKFLPLVLEQYFNGESLEEIKDGLSKNHFGYVDKIYGKLEQIKLDSLKLITRVMPVGHPNSLKEDVAFTDTIITYCINFGKLKKEIFKVFKVLDKKQEAILKLRYKEKKGTANDYHALNSLARTPELYNFVIDKILR